MSTIDVEKVIADVRYNECRTREREDLAMEILAMSHIIFSDITGGQATRAIGRLANLTVISQALRDNLICEAML